MPTTKFPAQRALQLPLLGILDADGGATPRQAADRLADYVKLDPADRARRTNAGAAGMINDWDRHIRFVALQAKHNGLLDSPRAGWWSVTPKGADGLRMARPGHVVTIFVTDKGTARWGFCEDAVSFLHDGEVNLILTSPPYPLSDGRQKGYGGEDHSGWLDRMRRRAEEWRRVIADDGSIVINLSPAWRRGMPTYSPLKERLLLALVDDLGLNLCQELFWENPSKMPGPAAWVTVGHKRLTPSVETLYWLSPSTDPNADNRRILRPYSDAMRARIKQGGERPAERPSGHALVQGAFARDNGGSVPHTLLDESVLTDLVRLSNTVSNDRYTKRCKAAGLPVHPARMPIGLAAGVIQFLTDKDDLVYDPHGGSLTTPFAAEDTERRWVADECSLTYLAGGSFRFDTSPGYQSAIGVAA